MKNVPLVTYENGKRRVIGEANIDVRNGEIIVDGQVYDRDEATRVFDDSMTGFSVTPQPDGPTCVQWRKPLDTPNMLEPTGDKGLGLVMTVKRRRRLPDLDTIEPLMVQGQPYTAKDLPVLDRTHEALGHGPEWMASERRAAIARVTE